MKESTGTSSYSCKPTCGQETPPRSKGEAGGAEMQRGLQRRCSGASAHLHVRGSKGRSHGEPRIGQQHRRAPARAVRELAARRGSGGAEGAHERGGREAARPEGERRVGRRRRGGGTELEERAERAAARGAAALVEDHEGDEERQLAEQIAHGADRGVPVKQRERRTLHEGNEGPERLLRCVGRHAIPTAGAEARASCLATIWRARRRSRGRAGRWRRRGRR